MLVVSRKECTVNTFFIKSYSHLFLRARTSIVHIVVVQKSSKMDVWFFTAFCFLFTRRLTFVKAFYCLKYKINLARKKKIVRKLLLLDTVHIGGLFHAVIHNCANFFTKPTPFELSTIQLQLINLRFVHCWRPGWNCQPGQQYAYNLGPQTLALEREKSYKQKEWKKNTMLTFSDLNIM